MAATGVSVADAAIAEFNDFKKATNPTKLMVMKIEKGQIITETTSESASFEEFITGLPADDCRYAVYKMDFTTNDGRPGTKLVMITWAPETSPVKSKMVYAGSKDALLRVLVGISVKVTATDLSELTEQIVQDACKKLS